MCKDIFSVMNYPLNVCVCIHSAFKCTALLMEYIADYWTSVTRISARIDWNMSITCTVMYAYRATIFYNVEFLGALKVSINTIQYDACMIDTHLVGEVADTKLTPNL